MARSLLAVSTIDTDGFNMTDGLAAANVDGHSVPNTGQEGLVVVNGSAGNVVVTIPTPQTKDGLAIADKVVTIAAGKTYIIGAFKDKNLYHQSDGSIHYDFDVVTSVTVAAIKIPG